MISKRKILTFLGFGSIAASASTVSSAQNADCLYIDGVKVLEVYRNAKGEPRLSFCIPLGFSPTFRMAAEGTIDATNTVDAADREINRQISDADLKAHRDDRAH